MIPIEREYILNTAPKIDILKDYTFTNESGAHQFTITAMEDGADASFSGTATAYFIRSNGTTCTVTAEIIGGKIYATLNADCYNVPGQFRFSIFNVNNGITCCVYSAKGEVYRTITTPVIDSGEVVPSLDDVTALFEQMEQARDDADAAATAASAYPGALAPHNAYNIIAQSTKADVTMNGITYKWTGLTCRISGTLTSGTTSTRSLFYSTQALPDYVTPGSTLRLASNIYPIKIIYQWRVNGAWTPTNWTTLNFSSPVTVPNDAVGLQMIFYVTSDYTNYLNEHQTDHVDISPVILVDKLTNSEIVNLIERRTVTQAEWNAVDVIGVLSPRTDTYINGVTFSFEESRCTLSGAIKDTGSAGFVLYSSETELPLGVVAGKQLRIKNNISPAWYGISLYDGSAWRKPDGTEGTLYRSTTNQPIDIPNWAVGMNLSFGVSASAGYTGEPVTIEPVLLSYALSNAEITDVLSQPRGIITLVGYDFNNATSPGTYILAGGTRNYAHSPLPGSFEGLIVLEVFYGTHNSEAQPYFVQRLYNRTYGEFIRYYQGGSVMTWSDWTMISPSPAPTAAGTYNLRVTVTGGVPTYSWVSV